MYVVVVCEELYNKIAPHVPADETLFRVQVSSLYPTTLGEKIIQGIIIDENIFSERPIIAFIEK